MSSDTSDEEMNIDCTPPELRAEAEVALNNLLPPKSKAKYMTTYDNFIRWKTEKNARSFSETVFVAYFKELSETKKSSTLWALYSMLRATMQVKHNINIKNYTNLITWLKRQSDGYKAKKSKIFTSENIEAFLNKAPDDMYLATKVALILGINGACRGMELTNITTNDIEFQGEIAIFQLRDTKTKIDRTFVIRDEFLNIFKKYNALRPQDIQSNRLFLNYRNGKCTRQVIGRHKILSLPKQIATFLNLKNPELYTGHCFRRTSATLLADTGANLLVLKRHGGWKSDKVAEGYVEDSIGNKQEITKNITKNIFLEPKNNTVESNDIVQHSLPQSYWQRPSLYTNPQPGCSRDPPVFIHNQSPPKFNIVTRSPRAHLPPSAPFQMPIFSSQSHDLHLTAPQPSALGESEPQPPLPSQQDIQQEQSSTRIVSSQADKSAEIQQTNISVPTWQNDNHINK